MDLDFSTVDEMQNFVTVPPGTYLCRIEEVVPGVTRNGHDRWGVRLVVAEGEFVGRQAAWDGIVFSERGLQRAKRVFAAVGLPSEGKVAVEPEDLMGRYAFVTVRPDDYQDPVTGSTTRRNAVPYDGYQAVPPDHQVAEPPGPSKAAGGGSQDTVRDDDIPF